MSPYLRQRRALLRFSVPQIAASDPIAATGRRTRRPQGGRNGGAQRKGGVRVLQQVLFYFEGRPVTVAPVAGGMTGFIAAMRY